MARLRGGFIGVAAFALIHVHCASAPVDDRPPAELTLSLRDPLALGAEMYAVVSVTCPSSRGCLSSTTDLKPIIEQATVEDPSVVDVGVPKDSPTALLRTKKAGTTTLSVTAMVKDDRGNEVRKTFTTPVRILEVDRVELSVRGNCPTPLLIGTGTELDVDMELWNRADRLNGVPDPLPVTSDVATIVRRPPLTFEVKTKDVPGKGKIQSTLDPNEAIELEVFGPSEVTSVAVSVATSDTLGELPLVKNASSFTLTTKLMVGDRAPCKELLPIKVTSDTPAVCTPIERRAWNGAITITTNEPGLCTLQVEVGSAKTTQNVEVRRNG